MLGQVARIAGQREEIGRADRHQIAIGGEQRTSKLVERHVPRHLLAQPLVISQCGGFTAPLAAQE